MGADTPTPGDWFLLTEADSGLAPHKGPGAWHPFLVKTSWPGPRVTLLPRSTTWPEGRLHGAHRGACGSPTCRIDEDGRISDTKLVQVDVSKLTEYSCTEPDDDVVEWAMQVTALAPGTRKGRR